MKMTRGMLAIYSSPDGESNWTPVKAVDVPEWIKNDPDLLARLVDGEACCDTSIEPNVWYMALRVLQQEDQDALRAALEKRMRKKGKRLAKVAPLAPTVH